MVLPAEILHSAAGGEALEWYQLSGYLVQVLDDNFHLEIPSILIWPIQLNLHMDGGRNQVRPQARSQMLIMRMTVSDVIWLSDHRGLKGVVDKEESKERPARKGKEA